nr:MAG TPA: hypothetical protein [Caudoviricetes sp.]
MFKICYNDFIEASCRITRLFKRYLKYRLFKIDFLKVRSSIL